MTETPETKVPGLSTPALTNGEFIDASSEFLPKEKDASDERQTSAIEIASELESNIKQIQKMLEQSDKEVNEKVERISERIERLRRFCEDSSKEKLSS